MATKKTPAPKRGRPTGAKTNPPPTIEAVATSCPQCGSTERERYFLTIEHPIAGETPDGKPYTHVVWRRTRCSTCGQVRNDRSYENRPTDVPRVAAA